MSASDIFVLVETPRGQTPEIVQEALSAARTLAETTQGQVVAVLLCKEGTASLPSLAAADRILLAEHPLLAEYAPETYLVVLETILRKETPRAVLVGSTSIGWDIAPCLAARLDAPFVLGCQKLAIQDGVLIATCRLCGGKMLADVRVAEAPAIVMILSGSFALPTQPGKAQVERLSLDTVPPGETSSIRFAQWILPPPGDVDITTQEILVAVGRGIQQKENLEPIQELADLLGGAVCASRPIVDQGWLPITRQVGKSGMTVKPKLYLALGISGAPEHQEGMAESDLIIAVNTDPKAPIFDIADYGVQMDLMDLVDPLMEALRTRKGA